MPQISQMPTAVGVAEVGDDLTVTNVSRVKKAIDDKACNAFLGQEKISKPHGLLMLLNQM